MESPVNERRKRQQTFLDNCLQTKCSKLFSALSTALVINNLVKNSMFNFACTKCCILIVYLRISPTWIACLPDNLAIANFPFYPLNYTAGTRQLE